MAAEVASYCGVGGDGASAQPAMTLVIGTRALLQLDTIA